MSMSWFGKLLLIDYATKAFSRAIGGYERPRGPRGEEDSDFSSVETRALIAAAEKEDFGEFGRIYRERRPRDPDARVVEYYDWFVERKKSGWM